MKKQPVLELRNLFLNYGTVQALKNVNLTFYASEIHAIVGEHGAGKSSIGLIAGGLHKPLLGRIIYNNSSYHALTLKQARKLGIEMVLQHSHLFGDFSIAENLFVNNPSVDTLSFSNKQKFIDLAKQL